MRIYFYNICNSETLTLPTHPLLELRKANNSDDRLLRPPVNVSRIDVHATGTSTYLLNQRREKLEHGMNVYLVVQDVQ